MADNRKNRTPKNNPKNSVKLNEQNTSDRTTNVLAVVEVCMIFDMVLYTPV